MMLTRGGEVLVQRLDKTTRDRVCRGDLVLQKKTGKIELPPFPWDYSKGLGNALSFKQLDVHYNGHHAGYVKKVNALIDGTPYDTMGLVDIILRSYNKPSDIKIFNNAVQVLNHSMQWNLLTPHPKEPSQKVLSVINQSFGSMDKFKEQFVNAGIDVFGSGYVWCVMDDSNSLKIMTTSNGDNPMVLGLHPILAMDVWEHAYYIDYLQVRADYLKNVWGFINWEYVEKCMTSEFKQM